VPKQREAHGLNAKQVSIKNEIVERLIEDYTRESGVRALEKRIGSVVRGVAKNIAMEEEYNPAVNKKDVEKSWAHLFMIKTCMRVTTSPA
jgi:ATP-dependent Lon protease